MDFVLEVKVFICLNFRFNRTNAFASLAKTPWAALLPYLRGPPGERGPQGDPGKDGRPGKITVFSSISPTIMLKIANKGGGTFCVQKGIYPASLF